MNCPMIASVSCSRSYSFDGAGELRYIAVEMLSRGLVECAFYALLEHAPERLVSGSCEPYPGHIRPIESIDGFMLEALENFIAPVLNRVHLNSLPDMFPDNDCRAARDPWIAVPLSVDHGL